MSNDEILENGTKVLIFEDGNAKGPLKIDGKYILGTVQSSKESDDLSYHGSCRFEQIYTVLGSDKKLYYGTYKHATYGCGRYYFRTLELQREYIQAYVDGANEKIEELFQYKNAMVDEIVQLDELINANRKEKHTLKVTVHRKK